MRKSIVLLFLFLLSVSYSQQAAFRDFKQSMQQKITLLANSMSNVYAERCTDGVVQCKIKSYNLCTGTSEKKCFEDFPLPFECVGGGAYLSKETTIRFPNDRDPNALTNEERQFVCTSALLDPYLKEFNDRDYQYGMGYIGTAMGFMRAYPSSRNIDDSEERGCQDYDPRFRPWYVAAASGSKNVIILMDTSGSMEGGRIDLAKVAVQTLIDTFSNNDFVAIIPFSNTAEPLVNTKLTRATEEFKEELLWQLTESVTADGETNYTKAFQKAFTMLNEAEADEFGSPCPNSKSVIIFITDGVPTDTGYKNSTEIIDFINAQMVSKGVDDIILFTYAMEVIDPSVLLDMSCQYNGIMFEILTTMEESEIVQLMRSYYTYIAQGLQVSRPIWTEPYQDSFGFGELVTVSLPVYYEEGDAREILGVVGLDVVMKTFYDFSYSKEETIKELVNAASCLDNSLSPCEVEELRSDSAKCGIVNCSAAATIAQCSSFPSNDIYHQPEDTGEGRCCYLTLGAVISIAISAVILIHIIAIIVYVCQKDSIDAWFRRVFSPGRKPDDLHIDSQQKQYVKPHKHT